MAWVYRVDAAGIFTVDHAESGRLAARLAVAYRQPLDNASQALQSLRHEIAEALEAHAAAENTVGR